MDSVSLRVGHRTLIPTHTWYGQYGPELLIDLKKIGIWEKGERGLGEDAVKRREKVLTSAAHTLNWNDTEISMAPEQGQHADS